MRRFHLIFLLSLLPVFVLGQTAVTVRGPAGADGSTAPGTTPTFTVSETPEFAWVANDGTFEATGASAGSFAVNGVTFNATAPGGITCTRSDSTVDASWYTAGTGIGWPASYTVVLVVRPEVDNTRWLFGAGPSTGASADLWGAVHIRSGGVLRYTFGDDTNFSQGDTGAAAVTLGQWHVISHRYTTGNTQAEFWVDGVSKAITPVATSASAAGGDGASDFSFSRLGEVTSNYADGSYCAIYVWTSAISNADREAVENAWISALGL